MRKKVIQYHLAGQPWCVYAELECGHLIFYKSYTLRRPKTMFCHECTPTKLNQPTRTVEMEGR